MAFPCPEPQDLHEVRALNLAFLSFVSDPAADRHVAGLPPKLVRKLRTLSAGQQERLAAAPLLLLSLGENDSGGAGREAHEAPPQVCASFARRRDRLTAASLGFAWQLARRDPYVLRLLSGASLHWCERLAGQPLLAVMRATVGHDDAPRLRAAHDHALWEKLLHGGVSRRNDVRSAAQLTGLQMSLTQVSDAAWRSAACRTHIPSLSLRGSP